jgi:serine/threonine protein kinase
VEVYETFEEGGEAFIVMEFVDGNTLESIFRDHVLRGTWLLVDEGIDFFKQLLEGLVFAHSSGLIHRDIKPSNILVSKLGVLKIADFGIAKQMTFSGSQNPPAKTNLAGTGSQFYMSFEQSRGENVDQRSDVFSAGIIGYLLFTGKHPFNHTSAAYSIFELIREKGFVCPEVPSHPGLPESVRKAIMKMLTKDKGLRYHSIYEPLGELTRENSQLCSSCSSANPVASNFCGQCGFPLKTTTKELHAEPKVPQSRERDAAQLTDDGFELTRVDNWEGAMRKYEEALEADPTYARAFANLGFALNRFGRYSEAIDVLSRGLKVTNDANLRHRVFDNRGFAKSNLKDFGGAIADFTEAIKLNDHNPRVLTHRAESYAQMGDIESAYDDVSGALDLDPGFWGALRLKSRLDSGRI